MYFDPHLSVKTCEDVTLNDVISLKIWARVQNVLIEEATYETEVQLSLTLAARITQKIQLNGGKLRRWKNNEIQKVKIVKKGLECMIVLRFVILK